jgi:intracellular septation protein A
MRWTRVARFLLESFGPLLVFLLVEHSVGLGWAIVANVVVGVALLAAQLYRERKVSAFTAFVAASVLLFGVLDLYFQSGFFIKIEPALGNATTGLFFLGSVLWGQPVVVEFARRQKPDLPDAALPYLRGVTLAWAAFFFLRTAVYVWMAYNVSLDGALLVRAILGPLSFGAMFAGEFAVRKLYFRRASTSAA